MESGRRAVPPLPPLGAFALSQVLEDVGDGPVEKVWDAVAATDAQYSADVGGQMERLVRAEQGLLASVEETERAYRRVEGRLDVDTGARARRRKTTSAEPRGERVQRYMQLTSKLSALVSSVVDQRKRVAQLAERVAQRDRLERSEQSERGDQSPRMLEPSQFPLLCALTGADKVPDISPVKLRQYHDVEQQLAEIDRLQSLKRAERFTNPAAVLALAEPPVTGVSPEVAQTRGSTIVPISGETPPSPLAQDLKRYL